MSFFQKPLDNFLKKIGNSILMPLTLCTQKRFLMESKLIFFFFFFWGGGVVLLHLHLEFFIGEVK